MHLTILLMMIALACGSQVFAQGSVLKPFREPAKIQHPNRAGTFAGLQYNRSIGSFSTTCDCTYQNGSGWGPRLGVMGEHPVGERFSITGVISLAWSGTSYERNDTRIEYVYNEGRYANIDFRSMVDVQLVTLGVGFSLTWLTPVERLFAGIGVSGGFVLDDNIRETEEALTQNYTYRSSNTRTIEYLDGSLSELYSPGKFRAGIQVAVRYEIPIAQNTMLAPELSYFYPLTTLVREYEEWNITSAALSCVVLFVL